MSDENIAQDTLLSWANGETMEKAHITLSGPRPGHNTEYPISASKLIRIKDDVWAWYSIVTKVQFFKSEMEEAKKAGFELLSGEFTPQRLMLHSQFRIYATHVEEDQKIFHFAYPQDIQEIEKFPIILASSLERPKEDTSFTSNRLLPPAEHGTIGIVVSAEGLYYYTIDMLSKEAQERQKHISAILEELENYYAGEFTGTLEDPETSMFNEDEEVRDMIQQLAQDYYQYHQTAIKTPKKRAIPHTPTLFDDGFADTPSCLPIQAVIAGIQDAKSPSIQWKNPKDHAPFFHYEKPRGTAIVEYKTGEKNEVFDDKTTASEILPIKWPLL